MFTRKSLKELEKRAKWSGWPPDESAKIIRDLCEEMHKYIDALSLRDGDDFIFDELRARVKRADRLHPEGPTFEALVDEVKEVKEATELFNFAQIQYELYDVATVTLRLIKQNEKILQSWNGYDDYLILDREDD